MSWRGFRSVDEPSGMSWRGFRSVFAGAVLVLGSSFAVAGPARADVATLVTPYLDAHDEGAFGAISGRVQDEVTTGNTGPRPRPSVTVLLVPFSGELASELEAARRDIRASMASYRETAARLDAIRERYETALRRVAGGAALIRRARTEPDGTFEFEEVPAGAWLVLARDEIERERLARPKRVLPMPAQQFSGNLEQHGHSTVTYWWERIEIVSGQAIAIDLTDRNARLTAIKEDLRPSPYSPKPLVPGRR
jgi:hypothetical protein